MPVSCALRSAVPRLRSVAEERLQDAEVGVARRLHVERLVLQPEPAVELQLRPLAGEAEPADVEDVLVERQLDRAVVAHAIVEQLEVELLDFRVDDELVGVGQLADDAHGAADDRGRIGREARLEEADVRIERRLAEADRQFGVHLVGERNPARAGDDEPGRRHFEIERQEIAAQVEPSGELPDALVAGKQVVHGQLDVVARLVERAGARRVELQPAGERRARKRDADERLDRDRGAVGVERVVAVPTDVGRTLHPAGALPDVDVVEADARTLEAQR